MSQAPGRQFANPKLQRIWHGADYSPEQWPADMLEADLRLMEKAHCQVFSIGMWAWSSIEPEEGRFEFQWLDRVMDRLAETGKFAALATPSAAFPAWLAQKHPEILRTGPDGIRHRFGNRVNFCWSSPEYKERCREMAERLAMRYGKHTALVLWHVSNEYGGECHCEQCAAEFRKWLQRKFKGDLGALNRAYWTTFWSHTFGDWDQIPVPGPPHGDESIIGLALDWRRFVTNQIVEFYKNEAGPLRAHSEVPVTTNLMGTYPGLDPWRLAEHLDVIAWDSYPSIADHPLAIDDWIANGFKHDLNRSLKQKPFLLIECTPSTSNWAPIMKLKRPGEHKMEALQAIAHGSDAVMVFQWRQSRGSAEKFHGAVVQHDGIPETRIFREVAELGAFLEQLEGVAGTETRAEAAVIYDWENAWAIELSGGPRRDRMGYLQTCVAHYGALWNLAIPTDVIESTAFLAPYKLVIAPMLYMVKPGVAETFTKFVEKGGTLVLTCYSGMVDENDLCFQGGFPGPLRKLSGIWAEEIDALHEGETNGVRFSNNNSFGLSGKFEARELCEIVHPEGAEVLATFESDFFRGSPALTSHRYGSGQALYIASRNDDAFTNALMDTLTREIGIGRDFEGRLPEGVFARRRAAPEGDYLFLVNFSGRDQAFEVQTDGYVRLDTASTLEGKLRLKTHEALAALKASAPEPRIPSSEPKKSQAVVE